MWEPDQRRILQELPNADITDGIPRISPSPKELFLVIAWITSGGLGYSQLFNIASDWTISVDLLGKSRRRTRDHPRILSFWYASNPLCRHIVP